jgi:hypothetical protein
MQDAFGRRTTTAHRIAYQEAVGPIPKGKSVLHTCDNPSCVNQVHLFLGTQKENIADMVQKGRDKFNRTGSLTRIERERRIDAVKSGRPLAEIAADAGIDVTSLKRWMAFYFKPGYVGKRPSYDILRQPRDAPQYSICESQKVLTADSAATPEKDGEILLRGRISRPDGET